MIGQNVNTISFRILLFGCCMVGLTFISKVDGRAGGMEGAVNTKNTNDHMHLSLKEIIFYKEKGYNIS